MFCQIWLTVCKFAGLRQVNIMQIPLKNAKNVKYLFIDFSIRGLQVFRYTLFLNQKVVTHFGLFWICLPKNIFMFHKQTTPCLLFLQVLFRSGSFKTFSKTLIFKRFHIFFSSPLIFTCFWSILKRSSQSFIITYMCHFSNIFKEFFSIYFKVN